MTIYVDRSGGETDYPTLHTRLSQHPGLGKYYRHLEIQHGVQPSNLTSHQKSVHTVANQIGLTIPIALPPGYESTLEQVMVRWLCKAEDSELQKISQQLAKNLPNV